MYLLENMLLVSRFDDAFVHVLRTFCALNDAIFLQKSVKRMGTWRF